MDEYGIYYALHIAEGHTCHIISCMQSYIPCWVFWCLLARWNIWWRWIAWSLWWLAQGVEITWNNSWNKWNIWSLECTCCVLSCLFSFEIISISRFRFVRRCSKMLEVFGSFHLALQISASCRGVDVKLWGGPASCFRRKDHWCSARGFGEYPEGTTARHVANVGNSL